MKGFKVASKHILRYYFDLQRKPFLNDVFLLLIKCFFFDKVLLFTFTIAKIVSTF